MAPRDRPLRMASRAITLAVVGVVARIAGNLLPTYPGYSRNGGFGSLVAYRSPALIWVAGVVPLAGLVAVTVAAIRLLRRAPRSRAIAGGILITLGAAVTFGTTSTFLYSIEYVRQVGDFYDVDPTGMWVGLVFGLASAAAFAMAGTSALAADRTPATGSPAMPSAASSQPAMPAPPPETSG